MLHNLTRFPGGRESRFLHRVRPAFRRKVFGIGLPKTGTTTLGQCFSILGYKHHSFDMDLARRVAKGDVDSSLRRAESFETFEDWPWFQLYERVFLAFPQAKFVLTVRRSTDDYILSLRRHRERQGVFSESFPVPCWWYDVFGYEPHYWNEDAFRKDYETHNNNVIEFFDRVKASGRLRVLCWENGHSWADLCDFLDVSVPSQPFPHANAAPAGNIS
jgi:hypothetical protein